MFAHRRTTKTLLSQTKFCKKAYERLIEKKASTPLKTQGKRLADDSIRNKTVNLENKYSLPFWCTKETKRTLKQSHCGYVCV